jgi:hypothetical protein
MRVGIYRAVRWRTGGALFALWTQMAVRVAVVMVLVWAALTFGLVWYWTGYYGGVAAHRYFGLWMLTWFFSEIIPLRFGSVPYRGARNTIPSMYPFLCYKYYSGGSFSGWFWHYAPWGYLTTAVIFVGIGLILLRPEPDPTNDRYVRGTHVIPQRRLRRELQGNGVEVGGIRIERTLEPQHFMFVGAPGSGKSTAIRRMLRQIEARGKTAVVLDPECEYLPEFFRPARGDLNLNPLDARCPSWSPRCELKPGSEAMDAEALAAALIPDPSNLYGRAAAIFSFGSRRAP